MTNYVFIHLFNNKNSKINEVHFLGLVIYRMRDYVEPLDTIN